MNNTCVSCGAKLPTEYPSMLCKRCEMECADNNPLCPSCGDTLELMNVSNYNTSDGFGYSSLFHCRQCHSDWEKEEEYTAKPVRFIRKFWG
jgi:transposase-like protein